MGLFDDEIAAERDEEFDALVQVNCAVSDYLLGLKIPEFAEENGGIDRLLNVLRSAHESYDHRYNEESY